MHGELALWSAETGLDGYNGGGLHTLQFVPFDSL